MSATPRVSVLMSMKNAQPYLAKAVGSILAQSFRDFEFVIVDNASTDGSAAYVEGIAATDGRVMLLHNECDLGQSGALNRGFAACRGKWIARMDADDVAMPERLRRQMEFVEANPDVRATSCLAYYIDPRGVRAGHTTSEPCTRERFEQMRARNLPFGILHPGAWIARDVLVELGGYRPEFEAANDIDLWCRISDRGLILVQAEHLMEYRVHGDSLSAHSYERARLKHLWARDCMIARRAGRAEPGWDEFLEGRRQAPWWRRLNRWRKMQAKRLYREAAQHYIASRLVRSLASLSAAAILQPEYTIPRFKGQVADAHRS